MSPSDYSPYLADFFGGAGGVGRAAGRRGTRARLWDLSVFKSLDLTDDKKIRYLCSDVKTGKIIVAMVALERRSWGLARHRANAVRSRAEPWGCNGARQAIFR